MSEGYITDGGIDILQRNGQVRFRLAHRQLKRSRVNREQRLAGFNHPIIVDCIMAALICEGQ